MKYSIYSHVLENVHLSLRTSSSTGASAAGAAAAAQGFPGGFANTPGLDVPLPGSFEAAEAAEHVAHEREMHTVNVGVR